MALLLVTAPTAEPLSLAEAKAWLRLDSTDEDTLVTSLVVAARQAVEAASGRLLMPQTWRLVLDGWPATMVFDLPVSPLRGVADIRVFNAAGVATTLAATARFMDAASDPPRLLLTGVPPTPGRPLAGIEIDLSAGYASAAAVPEPLKQALRVVLADLYERRGDGPDAPHAPGLPPQALALVAPFRRARL